MGIKKAKKTKFILTPIILGLLFWASFSSPLSASSLKALIVTGQNNHDWKTSSSILKKILEETGMFEVEVAASPPRGKDMSLFRPEFDSYQVVVLDYNGDAWSSSTQEAFVRYVRQGGGVVVYHAADNSFPQWKEYNRIIGLGGWGNRDESTGPYLYWEKGRIVRDKSPGIAGYHGYQHAFVVVNRDSSHPITRGLPERWMHARDELYSLLRGPAEEVHVLATAYSDPAQLGTGRHEPVLFTVRYGKGRIFHTVLGHAMGEKHPPSMECVGFIVTFQRGAEWAATGSVTQKVPGDFPALYRESGTPDDVRRWKNFRPERLEEILKELASYEYGQDEEILSRLRDYVRAHRNSPHSRAECETRLAHFLASDATLAAKMAASRQLREIGTSLSVPWLEKMLLHLQTSDIARYALEKIPGQDAAKALIKALSKSRGKVRLGIISSLGNRKSENSLPQLSKLLRGAQPETAAAAARAMGQVGTAQAAEFLLKNMNKTSGEVKAVVASSVLKCAENRLEAGKSEEASRMYEALISSKLPLNLRQAAMRGKISSAANASEIIIRALEGKNIEWHQPAITLIRDFFDLENIEAVSALLPSLPPSSQVMLLEVLSGYRKPGVLSSVVQAAQSKQKEVRVAALRALKTLGDYSTVELLARGAALSSGEEKKAARESLDWLPGKEVERAILLNLIKLPDPRVRQELIRSIGERRIKEGISLLLSRARFSEAEIRLQAIKSLKNIATPAHLPHLVDIMLASTQEKEREEMANTIAAVAGKQKGGPGRARPVVEALDSTADISDRCALLRVLGRIGDESSLPSLRRAVSSGTPEEREAAIRALADWPTTTPKEDLLELSLKLKNKVLKFLALRAYIRMIGLEPYRLPQHAVRELKNTMGLARMEEKKLVLSILPIFPCQEALEFARSLVEEEGVEEEARAAVEKIEKELKK